MQKQYGTDDNVDVIINIDKGDLELWRNREIVASSQKNNHRSDLLHCNGIVLELLIRPIVSLII